MKAKRAVGLFLLGLLSLPLYAESPCVECRKAALLEVQVCMAKAKTEADKSACTKKGQELSKACDNGACKQ